MWEETLLSRPKPVLDSTAGNVADILQLLGRDKLSTNVDIIITELTQCLFTNKLCGKGNTGARTKPLERLCSMLKIKINLVRGDPSLHSDYDLCSSLVSKCLPSLYESKDDKDKCIPFFCDIISLALLLQEQNQTHYDELVTRIVTDCKRRWIEFITLCASEGDANRTEADNSRILITLTLFESVLNVLLVKKTQSKQESSRSTLQQNDLFDDTIHDLFLQLISNDNSVITSRILIGIVPKFVLLTSSGKLLIAIWGYLSKLVLKDSPQANLPISHALLILCSLADYFIPRGSKDASVSLSLLEDSYFWEILQLGLVNEDSLVQKQALYLLKRSIDTSRTTNATVNTVTNIFHWDPNTSQDLLKTWGDFFLVLETADEKQVHLVTPVLAVINKLLEQRSTSSPMYHSLHESWFFCIFHRILKHDHKSVVTWGVLTLLQVELKFFVAWDNLSVLKLLFNTLNNSHLFSTNADQVPSEVGGKLIDFFKNLTQMPVSCARNTFSNILLVVSSISWGPVSLFYVVHALASIPQTPLWDPAALVSLKLFVSDALGTQNVFIRGGIQCQLLQAMVQLADTKALDLGIVADVLSTFRKNEAFRRGTVSWTTVVTWIKSFTDEEKAQKFLSNAIHILSVTDDPCTTDTNIPLDRKAFARIILLLCDSGLLEPSSRPHEPTGLVLLFQEIFKCFENTETRLYCCEKTQNLNIELLTYLLQEAHGLEGTAEPRSVTFMLNLTQSATHDLITVVTRRLASLCHLRDLDTVHHILNALVTLSGRPDLYSTIAANIVPLQLAAIEVSNGATFAPVQKYFAQRLLAWISSAFKRDAVHLSDVLREQKNFIQGIIENDRLNGVLVKNPSEEHLTRDLNTQWGRLVSGYIQATWALLAEQLGPSCTLGDFSPDPNLLLEEALDCLEITGQSVLIEVMRVLEFVLPVCLVNGSVDLPLKVVETCWEACFELRRTESFWPAIQQFSRLIYQDGVMDKPEMQPHVMEYGLRLLESGESVMGLGNLLLGRLQQVLTPDLVETYADLVVEALIFGPSHRRDQRFEDEAVEFIARLGRDCAVNELVSYAGRVDNEVRARGVDLLLRIGSLGSPQGAAVTLANGLMEREREETSHKTRYFGDSQTHRFKQRVVQALLLLQPMLDQDGASRVMSWACSGLIGDSSQPSVRYLLEWLMARILLANERLRSEIWESLRTARRKRPGSLSSFLSVLFLVAKRLEDPDFVDRSLQTALPNCVAQHFSLRLYAQVVIQKMCCISRDRGWTELVGKYALIESSMAVDGEDGADQGNGGEEQGGAVVPGEGNAVRNFRRLKDNWFFSVFDPDAHYCVTSIYHHLPRLAGMARGEWLPSQVFKECSVKESVIPLSSVDTRLDHLPAAAWVIRTGSEDDGSGGDGDAPENIQKKLVPWTSMMPGETTRGGRKVREEGLVVVASLLHKPPNVGGLCRTCEVFGAARFVIGHTRLLQDKQFTSLSVTAEKWITLQEVRPSDLPQYLAVMKKQGYLLVGAEQTANSTPIPQMVFPKKTLLLLGNEREGIPANLLPLLDVCVVVPQQGVVRSLNVHVTGAICVWEYARQHPS